MTLKVCVLTSAHPPNDVRIFHKECKSLARAGYRVTLIAPAARREIADGVRIEPVPKRASRLDRMLRGPFAIYRKALRENADAYHFHDPELIPIALLLQLAGKKVIYDAHEDLPRTFSYKSYIPPMFRSLLSKLVEIGEECAGRLFSAVVVANPVIASRFDRTNHPAVVVHNYPKIDELRAAAQPVSEARECDGSLLYVGMRITRPRCAEEMIQAMGLLPPDLAARLKLVGGWDPVSLPNELSCLPGWERTDCLGLLGRTGVAQALRQARAGLCLLHPEPNYLTAEPVKLFEYMCAGIPVIAADFPSCREIVNRVKCGILVNPLDPREIASAMEYLCRNVQEAEEMGRRGFRAVLDEYNWAKEEEVLFRVYRELVGWNASAVVQPVTSRWAE